MSRAMYEMSPDARAIKQRLLQAEIGELIPYSELSSLVCRPVSGATSALTTARKSVCVNDHRVFAVERKVGVRRLSDAELAGSASDYDVVRSRRHAKRAAKRMVCVEDFTALPNHLQLAHTIKLSFFGAIAWMAQKGRLERAAQTVSGRSGELPINETLKAFMRD